MKVFYLVILVAFIGIGLFGFSGFTTDHNTAFMSCLKLVTGGECVPMDLNHPTNFASLYLGLTVAVLFSFMIFFINKFFHFFLISITIKILTLRTQGFIKEFISRFDYKNSTRSWFLTLEQKYNMGSF